MSTFRKVSLTAATLLAAMVLVSILGGSMIWLLGGAHGLVIAGAASETPRPPDTVDVGPVDPGRACRACTQGFHDQEVSPQRGAPFG